MFKYKSILLSIVFFIATSCGGKVSSLFKKNDKNIDIDKSEESFFLDDSLFTGDSLFTNGDFAMDSSDIWIDDAVWENDSIFTNNTLNPLDDNMYNNENLTYESEFSTNDRVDAYSDVVANFQDQITKLKSELESVTDEVYTLKAKSQIWENPFSIYNKEIILNNGSTVYGKIVYQDQDILYVETLIGELTIQRSTIKRVVENITHIADSTMSDDDIRKKNIVEIQEYGSKIPITAKKLLANAILLGDVSEEVDFRGNRIFRGDIKNTGEARADFVKINFVFRMNWQGKTQSLTAFAKGSKQVLPDSQIESDSSIEPGAIGSFELVIPSNFGTFIGYSYSIDWEQYDD